MLALFYRSGNFPWLIEFVNRLCNDVHIWLPQSWNTQVDVSSRPFVLLLSSASTISWTYPMVKCESSIMSLSLSLYRKMYYEVYRPVYKKKCIYYFFLIPHISTSSYFLLSFIMFYVLSLTLLLMYSRKILDYIVLFFTMSLSKLISVSLFI